LFTDRESSEIFCEKRLQTQRKGRQDAVGGMSASQEKILIIKGKGGLGNRMLSAVTGLIYADLSGRKPIIDWRDGVYSRPGENSYPILFDSPLSDSLEGHEISNSIVPEIWRGQLGESPSSMIEKYDRNRHSSMTIYRKYCVPLSRLHHPEDVAVFWSYLPKMPRLAQHLRRDTRFSGRSVEAIFQAYLNKYFLPNSRIRLEVEKFCDELRRPRIGIHIRYTDRKVSLRKIEDAIRRRLDRTPNAILFLATDSIRAQERIMGCFENVHVVPKFLSSNNSQLHGKEDVGFDKIFEAENALIDMYLLSRCDYLIYSKNSTFSVCSALLGGLSREQQNDVDRISVPIVVKRFIQSRM